MQAFYAIFAVACWPVVAISALAFAYAASWKHPMPEVARRWVIGVSFLLVLALTFLFYWLANESVSMFLAKDLFFISFGVFLLLTFVWRLEKNSIKKIAIAVLGISGIAMGSWYLIGDYVLSRKYTTGVVASIEPSSKTQSYAVYISGGRYHVTHDLLPVMSIGERVRIEYGVASHSIFNAATIPAAAR